MCWLGNPGPDILGVVVGRWCMLQLDREQRRLGYECGIKDVLVVCLAFCSFFVSEKTFFDGMEGSADCQEPRGASR